MHGLAFLKFNMAAKMAAKSLSNMIFQQMKLGTSVIRHFRVILSGQPISKKIPIFKVIFNVKRSIKRYYNFQQIKVGTCLTTIYHGNWTEKNPIMTLF